MDYKPYIERIGQLYPQMPDPEAWFYDNVKEYEPDDFDAATSFENFDQKTNQLMN